MRDVRDGRRHRLVTGASERSERSEHCCTRIDIFLYIMVGSPQTFKTFFGLHKQTSTTFFETLLETLAVKQ